GILPPGKNTRFWRPANRRTIWGTRELVPSGRMPGSTAGETPAATATAQSRRQKRPAARGRAMAEIERRLQARLEPAAAFIRFLGGIKSLHQIHETALQLFHRHVFR